MGIYLFRRYGRTCRGQEGEEGHRCAHRELPLPQGPRFISSGEYAMIRPPEYILGIQPYVPGKPIEELERELGITDSVKLASNENPIGPSPAALKAIAGSLADLNRYPDGAGYYLKKALSEKLGVSDDEIILGNGSNELLDI